MKTKLDIPTITHIIGLCEEKKDRISCEEIDCRSCECARARNMGLESLKSTLLTLISNNK